MPYALLQQTDDVGHRQGHLDTRVLVRGKLAKLVHRSLLLDLIASLHSDSLLFLGRKFPEGYHAFRLRVAYFYELTGILARLQKDDHDHKQVWCQAESKCLRSNLMLLAGDIGGTKTLL